ncbi:MAG: hypothetical protein JW821_18510 [Deltaproteobacteria bacterium]|nr:hypothetical protein [Deltaproteobacteria bacterium]
MLRLAVKILLLFSLILFTLFLCIFLFTLQNAFLFLTILTGCAAGSSLLALRPPVRKERAKRKDPSPLPGVESCDVWLYAGAGTLHVPWYNAVCKEIGPCRLVDAIEAEVSARVLILPEGTVLREREMETVSGWLEVGGCLLCECPGESLAPLFGMSPTGERRNCSREMFGERRLDLKGASLILYGGLIPGEREGGLCYEREKGEGRIFVLALEYGKWALGITQGIPNRTGWKFRKTWDWSIQGIQTSDLRTDRPPPYAFAPALDLFDQVLWGWVRDRAKIPGWWYYPDSKPGAFILTFDEDWFGKKARTLDGKRIPATWFVVDDSDMDRETVESLQSRNDSVQFHWNRFFLHFNKFGPHLCLRKVQDQLERIQANLGCRPRVCRIHYLMWDSDFDELFYVMKDAGIQIDSSFGPGRGQHGYRFGTGFPYAVSDSRGGAIGILEVPFQIHEPMGRASEEDLIRLLRDSEGLYHTAIVGLFHPYYCLEGSRGHGSYRAVLRYLEDANLWSTDLEGWVDFWRRRNQSEMVSSYKEGELVIEARASGKEKMTVRFPDWRRIEELYVGGLECSPLEKTVLEEGRHTIRVRYMKE